MGPGPPDGGGDHGVAIRPMVEGDLRRVLRIERESFAIPWSERTFRGLLRRGNARLLVAEAVGATLTNGPGRREEDAEDAAVVGYAVVWLAGEEAELGDLAVAVEFRGRGLGRRLLEAALETAARDGAKRVYLEVRETNEAARWLYERAGFETVGRRPGYYTRPVEDAVVMRCRLPPRVRSRAASAR